MNKKLYLTFLMFALVFSARVSASAINRPDADKYYRMRHISGLYMTDGGFNSCICDRMEDALRGSDQMYILVENGETKKVVF